MQSVETRAGTADLSRSVQDRLAKFEAVFEEALNILDGDRGVVDEDADRQGESAKGHGVDGLADKSENDHRCQDREGDGHRDDERGAPASKEEENHHGCKGRGDDGFANDPLNGRADKEAWSASGVIFRFGGTVVAMRGSMARTPFTTSRVEALPL